MSILMYMDPFELRPNPWNSNRVPREEFEKLKKSLVKLGNFKPIVIRTLDDGSKEILGGFHRCEAAKELGLPEVPVFDLGKVSDNQAKEISLVDNVRYGKDDEKLLETLLAELEDLEALEAIIPDIEIPELEEFKVAELSEIETKLTDTKEETSKTLKFRFDDIDKAEEIENILANIAYEKDFKYSDGFSNLAEALYYALVLDK